MAVDDPSGQVQGLTEDQQAAIRRAWDESDVALMYDLTAGLGVRDKYDAMVVEWMAAEGHVINTDPGVANLHGPERAQRVAELLEGHVRSLIMSVQDQLVQAICVEGRYCDRFSKLDEGPNIAMAVADGLLSIATGIPLPITLLSVYLVRKHVLDDWCRCPKGK